MSKTKTVLLAVACLVVVAVAAVFILPRGRGEREVLVLCGGSMRAVLEDIIERYKNVSDDKVVATYGDSGELCAQIKNTGRGDIYVCHDPFMRWAWEQGLIAEWDTVGYLDLAIIVPKGNPKNIRGLKDLAQPRLRLGIGNQVYSTSGVIVKHILKKLDYGDAVLENVRMETKGHQQRCTDVIMGTLDASIVWNAVAHLFRNELEIIPIPEEHVDAVTSATYGASDLKNIKVTIGIIRGAGGSSNPEGFSEREPLRGKEPARRFYEFVTTGCRDVFEEYGFRPAER